MPKSSLFDIPTYPPLDVAGEQLRKPPLPADSDHAQAEIADVEAALQSLRGRAKTFHIIHVTVPAGAVNFPISIPDRYDWLTLYFQPITPAAFSFGPEGACLTINAFLGAITLPGTTNHYIANNGTIADYSFQIIGVRGYGPVTMEAFV